MPEDPPEIAALDPATQAVRRAIGASHDLVVRMARVMQMNTTDMTAVATLMEHGPMGVADLADRLGIRQPSATALADRLERAGRVRRVRGDDDRRRVTLTPTEFALADAYRAWLPGILDVDSVCRDLTDAERAVVVAFLERITEVMERTGVPG